MKSYSQYKQDYFIDFLFKHKRNGVFVDIGAHDGISLSNTYHFEKERNWKGICIEPIPHLFEKLSESRTCHKENCCISDSEGEVTFRHVNGSEEMLSGILEFFDTVHINRINNEIKNSNSSYEDIKLKSKRLNDILVKHNMTEVDYCSIDTEGAEYQIIKSIDFDKIKIKALSVENNNQDSLVRDFLKSKGYKYVISIGDDLFVKEDMPNFFLLSIKVKWYKLHCKIERKIQKLKS